MVWKGTPSGDYLAPCLVKLIDEVDARAPKRNRTSDGSIGDRAHASRTSDHNPDSTGCVCALDITDDPAHFDPDDFCEILRQRRDRRIKYMISDRRICASYATSSRPAWTWGPYSGSNPHEQHAHISVLRERADDTTTWFPAEPQEDDVKFSQAEAEREVKASFADIAGRSVATAPANWVAAVVADPRKVFELHRLLTKEMRVDIDRRIKGGNARTDAEIVAVVKNALG